MIYLVRDDYTGEIYNFDSKLEACKKMEEIMKKYNKQRKEIYKLDNGYSIEGKHIYYDPQFAITPLLDYQM